MIHAIRAALAAVLLLALAGVAQAAAFTVTTKSAPPIIYLFAVAPSVLEPGRVPYVALYVTDDKAACEAQAAEWSKALAPSRALCLPHRQKALKDLGADDSE